MTPKRLLQYASIGEAITWTILLVGMVLEYGFGTGDWVVTVGGSLHGAMFIAYLYCGMLVGVNQRFGWGALIMGGLAAIPPYATLLYDWWAAKRGLLEGDWRRVGVAFGDAPDLDDEPALDAWDEHERAADAQAVRDAAGEDARGSADATGARASTERNVITTLEPAAAPGHAHPADRRVAERGETPAKLQWLDPVVRWSVNHPATLVCTGILVAALIFTGAASGTLTAPYKTD